MSLSLPADPPRARSLTRVVPEMSAALEGGSEWFAPARSAIVWVIDGLGAFNLGARAGHARFLSEARTKRDAARTVFPSTTAAALTSLLTGALPGEHGIVGYRARVPGTEKTTPGMTVAAPCCDALHPPTPSVQLAFWPGVCHTRSPVARLSAVNPPTVRSNGKYAF